MTNATKDNTVVIYLIFVQYMKHNTDNMTKFGIWFDDNVRGVWATNIIVGRWQ